MSVDKLATSIRRALHAMPTDSLRQAVGHLREAKQALTEMTHGSASPELPLAVQQLHDGHDMVLHVVGVLDAVKSDILKDDDADEAWRLLKDAGMPANKVPASTTHVEVKPRSVRMRRVVACHTSGGIQHDGARPELPQDVYRRRTVVTLEIWHDQEPENDFGPGDPAILVQTTDELDTFVNRVLEETKDHLAPPMIQVAPAGVKRSQVLEVGLGQDKGFLG